MTKWDATWLFPVIWHCWYLHQHHVMPMALLVALLNSLCQDGWNNVQHNLFGHMMPLMLVPLTLDTIIVISGAIAFVRWRWLKWGATFLIWWCDAIGAGISIMWCWQYCQWHHCLSLIKIIKMRWHMIFWSCATIVANVSIIWHQFQFYMTLMALSMALLHFLGQDDQYKVQHDILVIQHLGHWFQHHMGLLLVSLIALLHSLGHYDWNEVQHDTFVMWFHWHWCQCHVTPVSAWHDASSILSGTHYIPYVKTIEIGCNMTFLSYDTIGSGITWYRWHHQWHHCISWVKTIKCQWQHCTPKVKMIKKRCNITFWSHDSIGTDIVNMWCQDCHEWHHCIPYIKMIEIKFKFTLLVM